MVHALLLAHRPKLVKRLAEGKTFAANAHALEDACENELAQANVRLKVVHGLDRVSLDASNIVRFCLEELRVQQVELVFEFMRDRIRHFGHAAVVTPPPGGGGGRRRR